jgi:ActR/RegA family two-component response regulator
VKKESSGGMQMSIDLNNLPTCHKALVVDDLETYQGIYRRYFERRGFDVATADSFQAASRRLDLEFFHVAAIDFSLLGDRNADGLRILARISRELKEGTETILLSAFGSMEVGAAAKEFGAYAVVEKPNLEEARFEELAEGAYRRAIDCLSRYNVGLDFLVGPAEPRELTVGVSRVLETVAAGGYGEVDSFVRRLLSNLQPLLRYSKRAELKFFPEKRLMKGIYWSKMLGSAVVVELGPREVLEAEQALYIDINPVAREKPELVIRSLHVGRLSGLICVMPQPGREEFEPFQRAEIFSHRP